MKKAVILSDNYNRFDDTIHTSQTQNERMIRNRFRRLMKDLQLKYSTTANCHLMNMSTTYLGKVVPLCYYYVKQCTDEYDRILTEIALSSP